MFTQWHCFLLFRPSLIIGTSGWKIKDPATISLDFFRRQVAAVDALPQLVVFAVFVGLFTGFVTLTFRLTVDSVLSLWVLGGSPEAFESLSYIARLTLPVSGALLVGVLFSRLAAADRRVGIVHVMERLSRHQGHLPFKNVAVQFLGGIIALSSGQSGGREGPTVHLGAAASSLLGQAFELPNNSMRTLVACGTAAAIAGSFNTPIAGVIFAMEVVMMEYTIKSFIPVIVAAVVATIFTQYFMGDHHAFVVPLLSMHSLLEIPWVILAGVIAGCLSAAYIACIQLFARLDHWPYWLRCLLAGSITGLAAISTPQIMGVGYDTVDLSMVGGIGLATLCLIIVMKTISSSAAIGLGLPVGLIGPTLVIGASLGGVMGIFGSYFSPVETTSQSFYVILGMAAMMAAVLQAPLAALLTVLELTTNAAIILPAMLIIVVACLVSNQVFGKQSVFLTSINAMGLQYPPSPITLGLQRVGVADVMDRDISILEVNSTKADAEQALKASPRWILVNDDESQVRSILNASDLRVFMDKHPEIEHIRLPDIPGLRLDSADIDYRATLYEARQLLRKSSVEALSVRRLTTPMIAPVQGVITQQDIDDYHEEEID